VRRSGIFLDSRPRKERRRSPASADSRCSRTQPMSWVWPSGQTRSSGHAGSRARRLGRLRGWSSTTRSSNVNPALLAESGLGSGLRARPAFHPAIGSDRKV